MSPSSSLRIAVRRLVLAAVLFAVLIGTGVLVSTSTLTRADVGFDDSVAGHRSAALTTLAKAATAVASPTVGIGVAVLAAAVLFALRRRYEAIAAVCLMAAGLAVAFVAKYAVTEPRPPARLWVIPPDTKWSFPSGHTVVAASVAIGLVVLVRGRWRMPAVLAGAAFTAVVAFSRVYLGVHYLPDVLAGCLSALVAVAGLAGVVAVPAVRDRLPRARPPALGGRHRRGTEDPAYPAEGRSYERERIR